MRSLLLLAGALLALATPAAAQLGTVAFLDRTPGEHDATAYLPAGAVLPGDKVDGSHSPVLHREVTYSGRVLVSLIGVTPSGTLSLRNASGGKLDVRVRCFWADADAAVTLWTEFNCYRAGPGALPAGTGNDSRRVLLRAFATAPAAETAYATAGRYSGSAHFRVEAM